MNLVYFRKGKRLYKEMHFYKEEFINTFFNIPFFYYDILISNDKFNSTILLNNGEATFREQQQI